MLLLESRGWVDAPSVSQPFFRGPERSQPPGPAAAPGCWACGNSGLPPSYRNFNWIANRPPWDKRRNLPRETLRVLRLQTHRDLSTNKARVTPSAIYFLQYIKRALSLLCTANRHCTGSQTRPWSPRPCKALFLASHVLQVMDVTTLFQQRLNTIPLLEDGKLIQYTRSNGHISFSFLFFTS